MSEIIPEEPIALQAMRPAPRAPWSLRDMILAGVVMVVVVLAASFALAIYALRFGALDLAALPRGVIVATFFVLEGFFVLPAWLFGPGRHKTGWASLGLRRFPALKSLLLGALALGGVLAINVAWGLVQQRFGLASQPGVLSYFGGGIGGLALAILVGAVVAGVGEEIFFRGFLYAGLRERWGVGWAVMISSAVFAVWHLPPSVMPPIFVMGMLFCWLYERTDSLWPGIALHATVNSLAFFGAYLLERYPELASGGL